MEYLRNWCTGRRPVHSFHRAGGAVAALMLAAAPLSLAVPAPAAAETRPTQTLAAPSRPGQSVADFYKMRNDAPLWLAPAAGDSV